MPGTIGISNAGRFFVDAPGRSPWSAVSGVTRDSAGNALGGCTVTVFESASGIERGSTISDANGNYTVEIAGDRTVPLFAIAQQGQGRTNWDPNNRMVGTIAGSPGTAAGFSVSGVGLTRTISNITTTNGIDTIDLRLNGTTGATSGSILFSTSSQIPAVFNQAWISSLYTALVAGDFTNVDIVRFTLGQYDSSFVSLGTMTGSDFKASITSSFARFSQTFTTNNASVAFVQGATIQFTWANGVAVDFTLRVGGAQLETGSVMTALIPTVLAPGTVYDVSPIEGITVNNILPV